ncbi:MAG: AAA family ATPase [Desulfobacterales bacterium]|nr:AAA family ATPase [Desulfobacterales bacterium]MDD3081877.1 AAA family ATPase [Desulfobacterales bacterium]MDD3951555.1 AAA family ATPase [Desulfobacterales bacterium]MDD4464551.1 AAA family ATPase [Desulfobacterales bacterium]
MGHMICIASQKGGTGKTTTTVNLSASLALFEKRTLVIDCDPQGNATTGLGIDKKKIQWDLYDVLLGKAPAEKAVVSTAMDYLNVLPARFHLHQMENRLAPTSFRERILRARIHALAADYDFILLDTPPSLGFLTLNALTAASWLIIPLQCQLYALEGLGQLLAVVRKVREEFNRELKIAGVLLTMCENKSARPDPIMSQISDRFQKKIFRTTIPRDSLIRDSSNFSKPLALHDILARGAEAYMDLADELIRLFQNKSNLQQAIENPG